MWSSIEFKVLWAIPAAYDAPVSAAVLLVNVCQPVLLSQYYTEHHIQNKLQLHKVIESIRLSAGWTSWPSVLRLSLMHHNRLFIPFSDENR